MVPGFMSSFSMFGTKGGDVVKDKCFKVRGGLNSVDSASGATKVLGRLSVEFALRRAESATCGVGGVLFGRAAFFPSDACRFRLRASIADAGVVGYVGATVQE